MRKLSRIEVSAEIAERFSALCGRLGYAVAELQCFFTLSVPFWLTLKLPFLLFVKLPARLNAPPSFVAKQSEIIARRLAKRRERRARETVEQMTSAELARRFADEH